jgi:Peptidase_C39 like family
MAYGSYCTQIGPDGNGGMRCGQASLASALLDDGYQSDPWELTLQLERGSDPEKDGTTCQDLISLADEYGLDGRPWTNWEDAVEALNNGEAVLCLLDNRHMEPRSYPNGESWNAMHWVRVVRFTDRDDMCYVYDPLTYMYQPDNTVYQGPVASAATSIMAAIMATAYWESGVILTSRGGRDLNSR